MRLIEDVTDDLMAAGEEYLSAKAQKSEPKYMRARAALINAKTKRRYSKTDEAREKRKSEWAKYIIGQTEKSERAKRLAGIETKEQPISSRETDASAYTKIISSAANAASGLAKYGVEAALNRYKKRKDEKEKQQSSATATPTASQTQPTSTTSTGSQSQPTSTSPTGPLTPAQRRAKQRTIRLPQSNIIGSAGRRMAQRRNKNQGQISSNIPESYQFSCWREEFLCELRDLRRKTKNKLDNDKIIDVMRGSNKITINPSVSNESAHYNNLLETTNGASIFAKATPPLKRRTTPMSDVYLAKQPGKDTAENVQKKMSRLFLGNRMGFTSNYDLSGHKSDDNDVEGNNYSSRGQTNEAYDENDETFRQHSKERFTAGPGDDTTRKRTTRALKAIAALNSNNPTKKKKKKKKDKEQG